jgi:predicted regulator of Ras-like GTPase activity (Roadblock/LC7/MglB family)
MSDVVQRDSADRLAAIASATLGLANGVSESYPLGAPDKVIIELERGYLLVCTISIGCSLGVLASKQASLGTIAYEMAMFSNRASTVLNPQLIEELKDTVGL